MFTLWALRQFGDIVDRFRERECSAELWDEIRLSLAALQEAGPGAPPDVAKKLRNAHGLYELVASLDNLQPRLLFYFDKKTRDCVLC